MFYHLIGIKELANKRIDIDAIWQATSGSALRVFLSQHDIIIVSLDPVAQQDTETDIILTVRDTKEEYRILGHWDTLEDAVIYREMLGISIIDVSSTQDTTVGDDIQNIIHTSREKAATMLQNIHENHKQEQEDKQAVYVDRDLSEVQALAEKILFVIEQHTHRYAQYITPEHKKKLYIYDQDLRKVKLGNNIHKIQDVVSHIMDVLDDIEMNYLTSITVEPILQNSRVSNVDLEDAMHDYELAMYSKKLGIAHNITDKFFHQFGITGIYIRFIWKDLYYYISNLKRLLTSILPIYQYALILSIIVLSIYICRELLIATSFTEVLLNRALQLVKIGLLGLWIVIANMLHRHRSISSIILVIAYLLSYIISYRLVLYLFSL